MSNKEFYIGWQPNAPEGFSVFTRKYLFGLLVLVLSLGAILALSQKRFSTGVFEFGKYTEVKGVYFNDPVPAIRIAAGASWSIIPLVGYGKHGADGIIPDSLNGKVITVKGNLIYNDGKKILQVDKNNGPVVSIGENGEKPAFKELGMYTIKGEIVDPKCYFGVMKPGEGKPHRDCAIRCILGGISPVMHVQNEKGESNYYLVVGANGEKMNEAVRNIVAEPVSLEARLVQCDDWIIMYVADKKQICRISYLSMIKDDVSTVECRH